MFSVGDEVSFQRWGRLVFGRVVDNVSEQKRYPVVVNTETSGVMVFTADGRYIETEEPILRKVSKLEKALK